MAPKNKSKSNRGKLLIANREAPKLQAQQLKMKKKRSDANRKKSNLFNQISSKGNDTVEPSNNNTEQMDVNQAMGIFGQEDIVMEILSRLPVQSLQRFKCVSSFWEALLSDPYFKKKHLNHANNDQNSQKLLISQLCYGKDDMFHFYCSALSSGQVVEDEQKLDCPSNYKPVCSLILCSCDGLVLLDVSDRIDKQLLLWNPSMGESIVLPHPESSLTDCVCGMGYDTTSDNYKILSINLNARDCPNISVEILTLESCSWRKLGKYPTGIHRVLGFRDCGMDSLAFVHGAFHWVGLSQNYTIISFNISNEVYGEIPLLERMCIVINTEFPLLKGVKPEFVEHGVSVLRGMLCFYSTYDDRWKCRGTYKLWVMKDYGVKESWTQLLAIQGTDFFYSAKPKYMFVDDEVLLRCKHLSSGCSVFKTSKGSFRFWPQSSTAKQGIVYTESLISPRLLI